MTKDKLREMLEVSGLWKFQYSPRLKIIKEKLKDDKELLKKIDKMKTAELVARIDRMQSKGMFGES